MTDSKDQAVTSESASGRGPTQGLPGKRVTQLVLVLLVVLGGTLSYALWSYSQLENIRSDQRDAWAELREPLASRYREIEKRVAKAVDEGAIPIAWAEKFRLAADQFRTTAQAPDQYAAAEKVEELLSELRDTKESTPVTPEVSSTVSGALDDFNRQLERESEQLTSPGCKLLDIFLEFREPGQFELTK